MFDVKLLLENEGFSEEIKQGFLLGVVSSVRPIHEILDPRRQDQQQAFENQFQGMSNIAFSYDEFLQTRSELIRVVKESLTEQDHDFLMSVNNTQPDWRIHDFEKFPSVQWKLQNLRILKKRNPHKHQEQCESLEAYLRT